jgi:hypothetical protein
VAPLRLGGLRGKQSTPSDWLGGTGELSAVGEQERHGAREAARSAGRPQKRARGNGMNFISGRVDCLVILLGDYDALYVRCCCKFYCHLE